MAESKQTARLDADQVPDPPVETSKTPAAKVTGVSKVTDGDLTGTAEVANVEVSGFEADGKAVTLRFTGVPAGDGKVPRETLDDILAAVAVAWQRPEDRDDMIRQYGGRS